MSRLRDILICAAITAIVAAILFPVFAQSKGRKRVTCLSHVKQLAAGLLMYASDSDDRLPDRDAWMDAESAYVKPTAVFRCPQAKGPYGYAFNAFLDRASLARFPDPKAVPTVYDSVNPIRNASDAFASLPLPGRHDGFNTVAYLDGHARRVR